MASEILTVGIKRRVSYRFRKFIQRFLAMIAAMLFVSFDLFIPVATEAFGPSPVLALVADTVVFGTTAELAAMAAPVVLTAVVLGGVYYYIWNQDQTQDAQALAQQKYCAANADDPVCVPPFKGGQCSGVPYQVVGDIEYASPFPIAPNGY